MKGDRPVVNITDLIWPLQDSKLRQDGKSPEVGKLLVDKQGTHHDKPYTESDKVVTAIDKLGSV